MTTDIDAIHKPKRIRAKKQRIKKDPEQHWRERIANAIAEALFINGEHRRADRLKQEDSNGADLGGWCRQAVINLVIHELKLDACSPA